MCLLSILISTIVNGFTIINIHSKIFVVNTFRIGYDKVFIIITILPILILSYACYMNAKHNTKQQKFFHIINHYFFKVGAKGSGVHRE